ncbi:hypothetical protein D3C76_1683030 [compost metagenome]
MSKYNSVIVTIIAVKMSAGARTTMLIPLAIDTLKLTTKYSGFFIFISEEYG